MLRARKYSKRQPAVNYIGHRQLTIQEKVLFYGSAVGDLVACECHAGYRVSALFERTLWKTHRPNRCEQKKRFRLDEPDSLEPLLERQKYYFVSIRQTARKDPICTII